MTNQPWNLIMFIFLIGFLIVSHVAMVFGIKTNLSLVTEDVAYLLNKQINIALLYNLKAGEKSNFIEECSQIITLEYLNRISNIRNFIETDIQATLDGDSQNDV